MIYSNIGGTTSQRFYINNGNGDLICKMYSGMPRSPDVTIGWENLDRMWKNTPLKEMAPFSFYDMAYLKSKSTPESPPVVGNDNRFLNIFNISNNPNIVTQLAISAYYGRLAGNRMYIRTLDGDNKEYPLPVPWGEWKEISAAYVNDMKWKDFSFENSWYTDDKLVYRKSSSGNEVIMTGVVKNRNNTEIPIEVGYIGNIPIGYRPQYSFYSIIATVSNIARGSYRIVVRDDGNVYVQGSDKSDPRTMEALRLGILINIIWSMATGY